MQTEAEWAADHIFDKMEKRLNTIKIATDTFKGKNPPYVGPATTPTADQVRALKKVVFDIKPHPTGEDEQELHTAAQHGHAAHALSA